MNTDIGSTYWLNAVMRIDLFAADREPAYDRLLSDYLHWARKPHFCPTCQETIKPGEIYRKIVAVEDGDLVSFATCQECLDAMLDWNRGKTERFESRLAQGKYRAALQREAD